MLTHFGSNEVLVIEHTTDSAVAASGTGRRYGRGGDLLAATQGSEVVLRALLFSTVAWIFGMN